MILAGDVGGTNTRLGLFDAKHGKPILRAFEEFKSREQDAFAPMLRKFLSTRPTHLSAACFGVAGPVRDGRVDLPNLPWGVDAKAIAEDLSLTSVRILNDLEACGYAIEALEPKDIYELNHGRPEEGGNRCIISAGTGLGESGMVWADGDYRPFPSEGGHVNFGPRNPLEIDLLAYLIERYGHVSYERVISGPGILNIYEFLRDTGRAPEPEWLALRMEHEDPPRVISEEGLRKSCSICVQTLDLFVSLLGSEAGNLALKLMGTGGVYLGGGIAPRILEKLKEGGFMDNFLSKGRMLGFMHTFPVRVIMNDRAGLLGAARAIAPSQS